MRRHSGRWVVAAVFGLVALGCARPGAGDGDSSPLVTATPSPPASAASLPPDGADAQAQPPGDGAPHQAENNGWKQRHDLTAEEQRTGDALAARIRPKLTALRSAGDFAPASTQRALLSLGLDADQVQVTTMRAPIGESAPPPGAVFAVHFPEAGCVIGDVRPERLQIEVTGAAAEFGCLEPFSH
ncbi:DUF6993 domain-containing protein [Paractinoplanes atraurantiacus]|uniref:DUF6993 domain-containing protein n=1 Tax=Paractinoplanes atraurantiacus TaxID=1036182 RepID=A0A285J5P2_9ACTN|nr:hypothetical protein [Actinoplanes atraurantiacus]SNY55197.1 hypothetical protein SAMN05421748_11671 [Actinoplanes atraurantiacus]